MWAFHFFHLVDHFQSCLCFGAVQDTHTQRRLWAARVEACGGQNQKNNHNGDTLA